MPTSSPEQELEKKRDEGDWSPERLAECKLITDGTSTAECGTLESFDLSACDTGSLDSLAAQGPFTLHVVGDDILANDNNQFTGALRFMPDGRVFSDGYAMREARVGNGTFFLSDSRTLGDGRAWRTTLVGCEARGSKRVTGCYASCLGGAPTFQATFEAEKVARPDGEGESSGLSLVGQGPVTRGTAADVFVTHGHAYVVALQDPLTGPGGLYVFDLSDRTAPRLVKSVTFPGDSYWNGVWAKDDALYVASGVRGVLVFDISNPADPQFLRALPGSGFLNAHTLYADGNRLYSMSAAPSPETLIFDITDAKQPVLLNRHQDPSVDPSVASFPHDATAQGDRLYVNHWRAGLLILDVSDPMNVVKLGQYTYPRATSHTNRVGVFKNRVIAFEGGEDWGAHLRVLDITDPTDVKRIGEYRLSPGVSIHNMELKGERLYISHYQHGVRVLDVSKPKHPREVAYYQTWRETDRARGISFFDGAIGMRVPGDGYVYVVDTARGLLIFPEP
ncbi:LVIVD repeat-containing protein [Pyxidicoccus sp. 3LG]